MTFLRFMGRHSTSRLRIDDGKRKLDWVRRLFPLFQERGLRDFRMDEVAASLEVSKATLYKYFASRDDLLELTVDWKLGEIRAFEPVLNDPSRPYLDRYALALRLASSAMSGITNRFLADLRDLHPAVWERITAFTEVALAILRGFYEKGIEEQALEPIHPAVLAKTDELFFHWMSDPDALDQAGLQVDEALEAYCVMKFRGIFRAGRVDDDRIAELLRAVTR